MTEIPAYAHQRTATGEHVVDLLAAENNGVNGGKMLTRRDILRQAGNMAVRQRLPHPGGWCAELMLHARTN